MNASSKVVLAIPQSRMPNCARRDVISSKTLARDTCFLEEERKREKN
jgi:hypothetical protein